MSAANNRHKINQKDLFDVFGVFVEEGLGEFDTPFPPKKTWEHNWPDENGIDIDQTSPVKFDTKKVTLKCYFLVYSRPEFYLKKTAFETELSNPGWQTWFNVDHNREYSFRYEGASNGIKITRSYAESDRLIYSFSLTLTVHPDLIGVTSADIVVTLNGAPYGTYPAGTTIINVATPGGGVTPTVDITGATVIDNNIQVTATGHPDFAIQYSLNGLNWQSSNQFTGVSNGSYTITARLVGTNIIDTFGPVVVNYSAPAPAETITITSATVFQNKVTVLATKANTTKDIEYSAGGVWQLSSEFILANGNYTITARLVGTTISDTKQVTVNYTPPQTSYNKTLMPLQYGIATFYNGMVDTEFYYNEPLPADQPFPASMEIRHTPSATDVGMVDFPYAAIGEPCAIKFNGQVYQIQSGFFNGQVSIG